MRGADHHLPVGLIAGGGCLPRLLMEALVSHNRSFCVLAVMGNTDPSLVCRGPSLWVSLGQVGRAIAFFKEHGVRQLVMAGKFHRPSLADLKVDWKGAFWVAQLAQKAALGDDGLLRFLAEKLESEGFEILAVQDILHSLLEGPGVLTHKAPSAQGLADIAFGFRALDILSPLDMGQAVVVQDGLLLGVEAAEGTDGLIERCGALQKAGGTPAILVKGPKTHQDERLDLPAIGPQTLRLASEAGFQGVAFAAHRTLLLEKEELLAVADKAGLFVMGNHQTGL